MKAQVAMEYIITYGWALIAVMVLVAGLSFFGIFRPEDTLPEDCYISTDIECKDFRVYVEDGGSNPDREFVELYVRNTNREDLYVSKVQCHIGADHNMTIDGTPGSAFEVGNMTDIFAPSPAWAGVLPTNRYVKIICGGGATADEITRTNAKVKVNLYLNIFTDSSFPHQIKGEIISKVRKI